jgi:hypothetical protein
MPRVFINLDPDLLAKKARVHFLICLAVLVSDIRELILSAVPKRGTGA